MGGGDMHKEPTPPNKANSTKLDSSFWKFNRGVYIYILKKKNDAEPLKFLESSHKPRFKP